jgi:hypothetical protein
MPRARLTELICFMQKLSKAYPLHDFQDELPLSLCHAFSSKLLAGSINSI